MSSQKTKENKKNEKFDDDSIESLKAYYKIEDSDDKDLYNFIKQARTTPDEE